ncbi:Ankyrin repeat and zinc finger domain-containing protein 1 [Eumeta japonica]|uniref:Ankyrin repeat and zinc finger domain-containing protein 1 n=1 Tax=Eumeta variegata TaxID=151549 RepID=A0A4C1W9V3_EUMVA|nr:Ankyrin repeat and zinc finger domain-containing protein 1 [Eumeta japonica]
MASSYKSEYIPKSVKVHDLNEFEKLLKGVKVAACMLTDTPHIVDEASVIRRVSALTLGGLSGGDQCSCCGAGPFHTRAQQTAHYKHHWHAHNLKRRLFGKGPLSLVEFNSRQDDNSSVSGSDSEVEDTGSTDLFAAATRHCKAFFSNTAGKVFCVYRCILHHKKVILMVSGGHFAGAVYSGGAIAVHKTLHSYLVRRGQGQAQSTRDQHGNMPKSAGASLRRYNQAQFIQHVQDILTSWTEDLTGCTLILYRASGPLNQSALFGKGSLLSKDDPRVRALPFPTRKPTFKEVQRAHATVANIEVYVPIQKGQKLLGGSMPLYLTSKRLSQQISASLPSYSPGSNRTGFLLDRTPGPSLSKGGQSRFVSHVTYREVKPSLGINTMELFQKALISSTGKPLAKTGVDNSVSDRGGRKSQKSPTKPLNRAKSREPAPRELPTQMVSSEDEGPCFIDSETPVGWIKTLSEQSSKGVITNSRKDLLNDNSVCSAASSDEELDNKNKNQAVTKKKKKKEDTKTTNKKPSQKIPASIKNNQTTLETIIEGWECDVCLEDACNMADPSDGNTALHKAAIAAKPCMVTELLGVGGDPCMRNHHQQTPYAASPHHDTRLAFRMFQASHPDKYNYAKSHIPGPATPQQLEEERERKAQQKRAKRHRDKQKQVEKIRISKFLEMTDAQKANACEIWRCFMCGAHLSKCPYEYGECRFCSTKCLQNHRNLRPLKLSA